MLLVFWLLLMHYALLADSFLNFMREPSIKPHHKFRTTFLLKAQESSSSNGALMTSPSLNNLMDMIGLDKVKQSFSEVYHRINVAKQQKMQFNKSNFNVRFDGNPGTGKTSVAKLYASMLIELQLFSSKDCKVEYTTGKFATISYIVVINNLFKTFRKSIEKRWHQRFLDAHAGHQGTRRRRGDCRRGLSTE